MLTTGPAAGAGAQGVRRAATPAGRGYVVTRLDQPPLASAKAPGDVRQVCIDHGMQPIDLHSFDRSTPAARVWALLRSAGQVATNAARFAGSADLVVQYPLGRVNERLVTSIPRRGRSVCLLHDLELLRRPSLVPGELRVLNHFDVVVAHSEAMAERLRAEGVDAQVEVLGAFDFLGPRHLLPATERPEVLFVFGNLSPEKAAYLYADGDQGAETVPVHAYGPGCDVTRLPTGTTWHGLLDPAEPALAGISGFGLVWDGGSADGLSGPYGDYLRYNAPHKFSLYLALGIPVIVPTAAAVASLVRKRGIGACADSVAEARSVVSRCSSAEWSGMLQAVRELQPELLRGQFTLRALARAGVLRDEARCPAAVTGD